MTGQSSFFFDLPADRQDDLIQARKNTLSSPVSSLEETESEEELGSPPSDYVRGNQQMDLLFGPFVTGLMNREDINEIYVNDDGFVWYDSYKEGKVKTKEYLSPKRIRSIIEFIAGRQGKIVNDDIPSLSAEIAGYGSRFQGELPPIVRHPQFNIRKKALQIFYAGRLCSSGRAFSVSQGVSLRSDQRTEKYPHCRGYGNRQDHVPQCAFGFHRQDHAVSSHHFD